ncbi:MAG: CU044_5270 family protein [Actinomycetota bacterium]
MNETHVMERLRSANPVEQSELEGWVRSEAGAAIIARVTSGTPGSGWSSIPRRGRRLRLVRTIGPAVALIAVLGLVAALSRGPTIPPDDRSLSPGTIERIATVAARQPAPVVPPGSFIYTRTRSAYLSGIGDSVEVWALVPETLEMWKGPDGSGRQLSFDEEAEFFGPADRKKWVEAGRPPLGDPGRHDSRFGPGQLSIEDFGRFSADTDELYGQLEKLARGRGNSLEGAMLVIIGDMLRSFTAPSELRATLLRVAARIPSVDVLQDVTDPQGREGIALVRESDDAGYLYRLELIIDPDTSELLAEQETLLEHVEWLDAEPGARFGYAVYLEAGIVDSVMERP